MLATSTPAKSPASSGVNMSLATRHTGQCAVTDRRTIRSCSKKVISTLLLFVVVTAGGRIHPSPSWFQLERQEIYSITRAQVWNKIGIRSDLFKRNMNKPRKRYLLDDYWFAPDEG